MAPLFATRAQITEKLLTEIQRLKLSREKPRSVIALCSSVLVPENETINYGDCILIHTDTDLVIFDCGHERHATEVWTVRAAR